MRFRAGKLRELQGLRTEALTPGAFGDHVGAEAFDAARERIESGAATAQQVFDDCDEWRLGDVRQQHRAAFTYLALAHATLGAAQVTRSDGRELHPPDLFHFAGHAFREIGQLNRAADAYRRAALVDAVDEAGGLGGGHPLTLRSFAQARLAYASVGQTDLADQMHCLEWDLRSLLGGISPAIWLWRVSSRYGTSLGRWVACLVALVLCFTFAYEALHPHHLAAGHSWTPWFSAFYFAVVTSVSIGFGDVAPNDALGEGVLLLNIVVMFALVGIGLTILAQKVIGR